MLDLQFGTTCQDSYLFSYKCIDGHHFSVLSLHYTNSAVFLIEVLFINNPLEFHVYNHITSHYSQTTNNTTCQSLEGEKT